MFGLFVFELLLIGSQVGTNVWLSMWSDDPFMNGSEGQSQSYYRLGVYGAFGVGQSEFHTSYVHPIILLILLISFP